MILKKPYAFFIKNFKLLHFILVFFMTYLIYRTNKLLNFLYNYIASSQLVTGQDYASEMFNIYMFIFPFLIMLISIIILSVMYLKKKPIFFYVVTIAIYLALIIIYNASLSSIGTLQFEIIDSRTIRLVRDFIFMIFILQCFSIVITFIRATGFDIKKFNFGQDLQALEITVEDNEEFEVDVTVDTNQIRRGFRKQLRFARYIYIENKFLINITFLILVSITCFVIYLNMGVYSRTYRQGDTFSTTDFIMSVNRSYVTNKDYKIKKLTKDKVLVVLELSLKSIGINKTKLRTADAELIINNQVFYHTNKYRASLIDLGHTYEDAPIPKEFSKEILVYEIPDSLINENMMFKYIDKIDIVDNKLTPKYISIKLDYINLDKVNKPINLEIGKEYFFNNDVLNKSTLKIDEFSVAKEFKADYDFCISKTECIKSIEFIKPNVNTNYNKTLLKISGQLIKDEETNMYGLHNLYNLIDYFGNIKYEIDGKEKKQTIGFNQIKTLKLQKNNIYYIEMMEEVKKANKITLELKIRNNIYTYQIK